MPKCLLKLNRHSLPSNFSSDSECDGVSVSLLSVDLPNDRPLETDTLDKDHSVLLPEILTQQRNLMTAVQNLR